jgi:hypothetical protein
VTPVIDVTERTLYDQSAPDVRAVIFRLISHHFVPRICGPLILPALTSGAEISGNSFQDESSCQKKRVCRIEKKKTKEKTHKYATTL